MGSIYLSRIHEERLKEELAEMEALKTDYSIKKSEAHAEGDLRENQAYHTYSANLEKATEDCIAMKEKLYNGEILEIDNSSVMKLCSIFEIWELKEGAKSDDVEDISNWEYQNIYMLMPKGQQIIDGIMSPDSNIGKEIFNKTCPIGQPVKFKVGNLIIRVVKVSSESSNKFIDRYCSQSEFFRNLFTGGN